MKQDWKQKIPQLNCKDDTEYSSRFLKDHIEVLNTRNLMYILIKSGNFMWIVKEKAGATVVQ